MKTTFNFLHHLSLAAALTAVLGLGLPLNAADEHLQMKGGQHLQHLTSPKQASDLKKGDTIAMVCAMCKDVTVTRVEKKGGREFLVPGNKHNCAMCGGTVTSVGQRADKKDIVTHSCDKCGGESAFCCATKKGMEKK